jgi:ABC-2 type transport system ATP-binding protein
LLSKLQGIEAVGKCGDGLVAENSLTMMTKNGSALVTQVVRALDGAGINVEQLNLSVPTLDEVFLKLTGKTLNVVDRKQTTGGWGRRRR